MNKKTLILCLLIPLLVGGLSSFLTKDSIALYETLNKPLFYTTCMAFSYCLDNFLSFNGFFKLSYCPKSFI